MASNPAIAEAAFGTTVQFSARTYASVESGDGLNLNLALWLRKAFDDQERVGRVSAIAEERWETAQERPDRREVLRADHVGREGDDVLPAHALRNQRNPDVGDTCSHWASRSPPPTTAPVASIESWPAI